MSGTINVIPTEVVAADWTLTGGGTKVAALGDLNDATYLQGAHSNMQGKPIKVRFAVPTLPAGSRIDRVVPRIRVADTRNTAPQVRFYSRFRQGNKFHAEENMKAGGSTAIVDRKGTGRKTTPRKKPWLKADFGPDDNDIVLLIYTRKYKATQPNTGAGRVYQVSLDVIYNEGPVASIEQPTEAQVVNTMFPTLEWTYDDAENDEHAGSEVKVFSAAQYGQVGFDPATSEAVFEIRTDEPKKEVIKRRGGHPITIPHHRPQRDLHTHEHYPTIIEKQATTRQCTIPLEDGGTYRVYVRVFQQWRNKTEFPGDWSYKNFTVSCPKPAVPTLTIDTSTQDDGYLQFQLTDNDEVYDNSMLILEKAYSADELQPAIANMPAAVLDPVWTSVGSVVKSAGKVAITINPAVHNSPNILYQGPRPSIFSGLPVPPGTSRYRFEITAKLLGELPAGMYFYAWVGHKRLDFLTSEADNINISDRLTVGVTKTFTIPVVDDWLPLSDDVFGLIPAIGGANPLGSAGTATLEIYDVNLVFDNFTWVPVRNVNFRPTQEGTTPFWVQDYEVPANHEMWYRARCAYHFSPPLWTPVLSNPTAPQRVTMVNEKKYLKNPLSPGFIMELKLEDNKITREFSKQSTTFRPMGAKFPIVVSDVDTAQILSISTILLDDDADMMKDLQEQKTTLLLQTPHYFSYVQIVNTVKVDEYIGPDGPEGSPSRWVLDLVEVEMPDV